MYKEKNTPLLQLNPRWNTENAIYIHTDTMTQVFKFFFVDLIDGLSVSKIVGHTSCKVEQYNRSKISKTLTLTENRSLYLLGA